MLIHALRGEHYTTLTGLLIKNIPPELYLSSRHCPARKMSITLNNSMRNKMQGTSLKHVIKARMAKGRRCVREARRAREIENHHSNVRELAWKPQVHARG